MKEGRSFTTVVWGLLPWCVHSASGVVVVNEGGLTRATVPLKPPGSHRALCTKLEFCEPRTQQVCPGLIDWIKTHLGWEHTDCSRQVKPILNKCAHVLPLNRPLLSSSDSPIWQHEWRPSPLSSYKFILEACEEVKIEEKKEEIILPYC